MKDPGSWTVVVLPDDGRQTLVITQRIRQLATGQLEIIHQVVRALQMPAESKFHPTHNVLKVNPGIDVIAVFGNWTSRSTANEGRDVLARTVNAPQAQNTGLKAGIVQGQHR